MFDFGLMPLFAVEKFVVTFNPNGPECDALKEVPNFDLFAKFLPDPFPEQSLFPMEVIMIAGPHPTKLM